MPGPTVVGCGTTTPTSTSSASTTGSATPSPHRCWAAAATAAPTATRGWACRTEAGKRFERGNGFYIEPAAELAALWSGRASYATANGLAVEVPATRSLQLRLGVTVGQKWQGGDESSRQVYGKAVWVNEYAGDSTVRVDGVGFESSLKGHQRVTGLGFVEDTGSRQVYVDVEKSWGSATSKQWGVNLGCRWKF